jgi:uncharacterized membrane protein
MLAAIVGKREETKMKRIARSVLQCFVAGVLAVLPLMITVAAVVWVAGFLAGLLGPNTILGKVLERLGLQFASDTTVAYVFGWILVLAAIFILGVLVEMGAKRLVQGGIDGLANRVPFLGGLYGTARQLVGMMDKKESADLKGMSVVFCIFGKESGAAFLALLPTPERFRVDNVDYHAVIVPTAPVPVGGSLIFVPAKSVRRANLSVDAFMSIYVSMGVTGPQFLAAGKDE